MSKGTLIEIIVGIVGGIIAVLIISLSIILYKRKKKIPQDSIKQETKLDKETSKFSAEKQSFDVSVSSNESDLDFWI